MKKIIIILILMLFVISACGPQKIPATDNTNPSDTIKEPPSKDTTISDTQEETKDIGPDPDQKAGRGAG